MRISGKEIIAYVATMFDVDMAVMTGPRRTRQIARTRQLAMYAMREFCPHLSYPAMGRLLGGRDHTTVLHGVRKITALIAEGDDTATMAFAQISGHFSARHKTPASLFVEARIIAAERHLEALYVYAGEVAAVERRMAA